MNFFQDMVSDKEGHASSKRMMSIVAFLLFCYVVIQSVCCGKTIDQNLLTPMLVIILGLSGASTVENMGTKTGPKTATTTTVKQTTEKTEP